MCPRCGGGQSALLLSCRDREASITEVRVMVFVESKVVTKKGD